jgi:hypothetical protein
LESESQVQFHLQTQPPSGQLLSWSSSGALILTTSNNRQTFYNVSIGVCGFAVASEIGSLPLRSHTQGVIGLTQVFSGWVIIFTIPYIINPDAGNLGGKIGYMFFGLGILVTVLLYFYCPETKGLSYDEVRLFICWVLIQDRLLVLDKNEC